MPANRLPRARRAIAVIDVVESVRLMQANEADVIRRWQKLVVEVRDELLPAHGGRLVKSLGDGLLIVFLDEAQALAGARALQRRMPLLNGSIPANEHMQLRIGLHVSDVVTDKLDIYGAGVNLAARLAGLAGPGQIAMSAEFRDAVAAGAALDDVEDLGRCYLKHIDEPVQAYRIGHVSAGSAAPPPPPDGFNGVCPTVAVLRFTPASGAHDQGVVAELLVDTLIARLAVCPGLHVISRMSARTLDPEYASGAAIWTALHAHYVVRGRVHALAGQLVSAVELVDTSNEQVIWAGRQPLRVEDLLNADDDFSIQLARELAQHIGDARLRRARTAALPTLDGNLLQFSASSLMHHRDDDAFTRSHALLDHLIDRFPRLPSPRAWAAMWYVLQVTRGLEHDPSRVADRALDHVHRALDHDPDCSLALAMAGFVHCHLRRDLATADDLLSKAVALNPNEAWAWLFKSVVAAHRGEAQSAWDWATRASVLSPLDPLSHYFDALRGSAAVAAERWDDAVRLARRSLAVNGNNLTTMRGLTIALVSLDQMGEAREMAQRILAADPGFTLDGYLAGAPPEGVATRRRYIDALRQAGLPMH